MITLINPTLEESWVIRICFDLFYVSAQIFENSYIQASTIKIYFSWCVFLMNQSEDLTVIFCYVKGEQILESGTGLAIQEPRFIMSCSVSTRISFIYLKTYSFV